MSSKRKKTPFPIYWIYAIIGVSIIAFQLFMSSNGKAAVSKRVFLELVEEKFVQDVEIINKKICRFKLTDKGVKNIKKSKNKDFSQLKKNLSKTKDNNLKIEIENIGDVGNFENDIKSANPDLDFASVDEPDYIGTIISSII